MAIKIGPAGIGSVKDVEETFARYKELGIQAAEISFTYGVFIKSKEVAEKVKKAAEKFNISLTIHAPYWINLNSKDKEKIKASKKRILRSCEVGTWLGAKKVVFHCGYYGKFSKKETYESIKKGILEMQEEIKKNKYTPKLAPEIIGKANVFGSLNEIAQLVRDTRCSFCIDFAHMIARYKTYNFKEVKKVFKQYKDWHVHFSGIEYGKKGEKRHLATEEKEIKRLLKELPKNKSIVVIYESPNPIKDAIKTINIKNNSETFCHDNQ